MNLGTALKGEDEEGSFRHTLTLHTRNLLHVLLNIPAIVFLIFFSPILSLLCLILLSEKQTCM